MRIMKDSTNVADTRGAVLRAGYVNGKWTSVEPGVQVQISVYLANEGNCGDVENGDMTPAQAPIYISERRAAGVPDPWIYCNESTWPDVQAAFRQAKVVDPLYWIANWTTGPVKIPGAVAHQYADPITSGGHFDLSVVDDFVPGLDTVPVVTPVVPAVVPVVPPELPGYYTVVAGDTMSGIAAKLHVSLLDLEAANRVLVPNPNLIYPGQHLVIPSVPKPLSPPVYHPIWRTYWVRPGDYLAGIAAKLGFSLRVIEQWNPQLNRGRNFNLLYPGDRVHYLK